MNSISNIQIEKLAQEISERLDDNRVVDSLVREIAAIQLEVRQLNLSVKQLSAIASMRDLLLPLAQKEVTGKNKLKIDATAPLASENGFHQLEYDANSHPYRWTGSDNAFFFELALDRSTPLVFELRCIEAGRMKAIAGIQASIDGMPITASTSTKDGIATIKGTIPSTDNSGYTRIEFSVSDMLVPATINPDGGDQRRLGVAFFDLSIAPLIQATPSSDIASPQRPSINPATKRK